VHACKLFSVDNDGEQVEHERVGITTQLGDDERHPLGHQAGNLRDVAGKPVVFARVWLESVEVREHSGIPRSTASRITSIDGTRAAFLTRAFAPAAGGALTIVDI
jgi:hypothetical protein